MRLSGQHDRGVGPQSTAKKKREYLVAQGTGPGCCKVNGALADAAAPCRKRISHVA